MDIFINLTSLISKKYIFLIIFLNFIRFDIGIFYDQFYEFGGAIFYEFWDFYVQSPACNLQIEFKREIV